jgi:protoporphyrinogen oxidase
VAEPLRVAILGAGPAGLGLAYRLRREGRADVRVFERADRVGGIAASFDFGGQRVDFGSHRLHPSCDPEVLADLRALLGDDLRTRLRRGRIRLRGRWVGFPLRPLDLLLRLDPGFGVRVAGDLLRGLLARRRAPAETFAEVVRQRLGATIGEGFYFPYARKLWGLAPAEISAEQARRRIAAGSFGRLLRKVLGGVVPFVPRLGYDFYYYPRRGFGQISEALAEAAERAGARIELGRTVVGLVAPGAEGVWTVRTAGTGGERVEHAAVVFSTLPVSLLARIVDPPPPPQVLAAAAEIRFRSMVLVYLRLPVDRFTDFDAHYFPETEYGLTRLQEPKHYAGLDEPSGSTVICAEIPCQRDDGTWSAAPEELARRVGDDLDRAGIPLPAAPLEVTVRRLPEAYPVYQLGFESRLARLEDWVASLPGLIPLGRQGLFVHDNTHHALFMAYCAAACLGDAGFDRERWEREFLPRFATHVVED